MRSFQQTIRLLNQSYIFTRAELLFKLCHEIPWSRALEHLENVKLKMQCINCKNKHLICLTYFTVNSVIQDLIQSPGNCKLKLLWSAIWYVCTRSGMYTYSGIWELKKCNRTYHHNGYFVWNCPKIEIRNVVFESRWPNSGYQ